MTKRGESCRIFITVIFNEKRYLKYNVEHNTFNIKHGERYLKYNIRHNTTDIRSKKRYLKRNTRDIAL